MSTLKILFINLTLTNIPTVVLEFICWKGSEKVEKLQNKNNLQAYIVLFPIISSRFCFLKSGEG